MSDILLSAIKTGMTRLRTKGGASQSSLFELTNAYVTAAKTIAPRPGSKPHAILPAGTIGIGLTNGVFQVFSDSDVGSMPENFNLNVLKPPEEAPDATLVRIWKAEPLQGGLYVVAEWSDDPTRAIHYWVRGAGGGTWLPNHVYMLGEIVKATAGGSLSFEAGRTQPADKKWEAGMEVRVGDVVEPTVFNGYKYTAKEVYGEPARTGATEPKWIAGTAATVVEDADAVAGGSSGGTSPGGGSTSGPDKAPPVPITTGPPNQPLNGDFEAGNTGWTLEAGFAIVNDPAEAYEGDWLLRFTGGGLSKATNDQKTTIQSGLFIVPIRARIRVPVSTSSAPRPTAKIFITKYDVNDNEVGEVQAMAILLLPGVTDSGWLDRDAFCERVGNEAYFKVSAVAECDADHIIEFDKATWNGLEYIP